jgi:hypothetical protein
VADPKTYSEDEYNAMIAERDALKANRDEILRESKKAKDALKNYDGVDPAEFKTLKEAAAEAERKKAASEGDFKALEKQLIDRHTAELGVKDAKIGKLNKALEKRLIDAKLAESLAKHEAEPTMLKLLQLEGRQYVRVRETDDDYEEYVVDAKGNPLIADGKGTAMTVDDLVVQRLKTDYPAAFKGSGSSGGGASKSTPGGSGGVKVIAAGDKKGFIDNLADIASGKAQVR